MSDIKHTLLTRDRKVFIQRSLSQSSGRECNHQLSPMQKCAKKIDKLKQQTMRAEEELEIMNLELDNLRHNQPMMIKNVKMTNEKEIQMHKDVLAETTRDFERSVRDIHALTLKEEHLTRELEKLMRQHTKMTIETERRNYNLFKKGHFQGYLESAESFELQEPCRLDDIGKLWSEIRETEKELLKWQNIDFYRAQCALVEEDTDEYLIGFIKDALFHFIMDDDSSRRKQEQLHLLIGFFRFSDQEMAMFKKQNAWPT